MAILFVYRVIWILANGRSYFLMNLIVSVPFSV